MRMKWNEFVIRSTFKPLFALMNVLGPVCNIKHIPFFTVNPIFSFILMLHDLIFIYSNVP